MLFAIAIDDEIKALERFKRIIKQDERISLIGSFTKTKEAMEFIKKHDVDVVFLDIEMPKINGLEFSESIFELKPEIDVVFVTAYDKYALQAFQVHATGYLLKPVDIDDIKKQVANFIKRRQVKHQEKKIEKLTVLCMGQFLCLPNGDENKSISWRTSKAEELFAFLIHCQGRTVSKERIIDTLWPKMDMDRASKNLHATCYYIREVLADNGYEDLFIRYRGSYKVKMDYIQCDMIELIQIIENTSENSIEILEHASHLYKGYYLDDRHYEWANNMAMWLENGYEMLQYKLANIHRFSGATEKETEILKKIIYHNPLADKAYKTLIELFLRQNDRTSALMYYQKYEDILKHELGIEPSEQIKGLIKKYI